MPGEGLRHTGPVLCGTAAAGQRCLPIGAALQARHRAGDRA